jgi:predicted HicB family RNase H-like nuclease
MGNPNQNVAFNLRLDSSLKMRAKMYAKDSGWSLNTFIVRAIQDRVAVYDAANEAAERKAKS